MHRSLISYAVLFCGLTTSSKAVITISGNNSPGTRYLLASSTGVELPSGSAIRVGLFNDPVTNAVILQGNNFASIDALFTPIGEGDAGGGNVVNPLSINATPGRFSFSVLNITQAYLQAGLPLYYWAFNNANPAQATEWAIFTNDDSANAGTPWVVPVDDPNTGGSRTLTVTTANIDDASDLVRGTYGTSTTPPLIPGDPALLAIRLSPIPEPSLAALCLTATGLWFRRRRTQG